MITKSNDMKRRAKWHAQIEFPKKIKETLDKKKSLSKIM